jgi:hypothetical protein
MDESGGMLTNPAADANLVSSLSKSGNWVCTIVRYT